ncbi:MAG: helix-hairpin-helix domain-containing protein [Bacilli bacterium]|nr:helix-hairpin-helix domain-containing protein [Bacilli bacterium]
MVKTLIGVIVVAIAVIVVFMFIDPSIAVQTTSIATSVIVNDNTTSLSLEDGYFSATVEGDVSKPGSYVLEEGATMGDLIEKAGGVTEYADEFAYYLDAEVQSGQTYFIASKYDTSNVCTLTDLTKVNINTDDAETLIASKLFTTSVANSIVSHRLEHGEFRTIEDLLDVYGIGNATYRKVRNYVTLHA